MTTHPDQSKSAQEARRQADRQLIHAAVERAARRLAVHPAMIDEFRAYAACVRPGHGLLNALAMFGQNPDAVRVDTAKAWRKGGRRPRGGAAPMRIWRYGSFHPVRVFDVRDTVPTKPCTCGSASGQPCPDSCQACWPVPSIVPTHQEIVDLLIGVLRDHDGVDTSTLRLAGQEGR